MRKRPITLMVGLLFAWVFCLTGGALGSFSQDHTGFVSQKAAGYTQTSSELVFIDPSVQDADMIVTQLPQGAKVVRLSSGVDGVAQISAYLEKKRNLSTIRIISHGSAGYFVLNGKRIDVDFLRNHGDRIVPWGRALAHDGDILLYACNLASEKNGKRLVAHIGRLTGAHVGASRNPTGKGGDWVLEYTQGPVGSAPLHIQGYPHCLETYEVTSTTDTGSETDIIGKLSWAITQSNAGTEVDDTIAFSLTSGSTVTLTGALPVITDAVTIDGDDEGTHVAVEVEDPGGESEFRVFNINASGETVSISNMTIRGGDISSGGHYGGGIWVQSGTLNLDSVTVSGSKARKGGGIALEPDGTMTMTNSTVSGNTASDNGGGIDNRGTITELSNTTVSNNEAGNSGGGIYNGETITLLSHSTISGNTTAQFGGGIYNDSAVEITELSNSTISGNDADSGGGGICNFGYNVTVKFHSQWKYGEQHRLWDCTGRRRNGC